jgi:hypothetical protein
MHRTVKARMPVGIDLPVCMASLAAANDLSRCHSAEELSRADLYVGTLASVRTYGTRRLLLLNEYSREGQALSVWLAETALRAPRSRVWLDLISPRRSDPMIVCFVGCFSGHAWAERLSADIWRSGHVWLCIAGEQARDCSGESPTRRLVSQ